MTKKRLAAVASSIDRLKVYTLPEAIRLVRSGATAKFDETIEVAINLGIDAQKTDQSVRGVAQLPHGSGKTYRVAVFAQGGQADAARAAGADIVGAEDLVEQIQKGIIEFDRCVATPDMMALVGRVAKVLGPRGLMPSPKSGTVSVNVAATIQAVKGGQVEFRSDKGGVVHAGVGKASFPDQAIEANVRCLVEVLQKERPSAIKGVFVKSMVLSSTMGVGVAFSL